MRSLWRWITACAAGLVVLASSWWAAEAWLGWDRSTAVTVTVFVATLAFTALAWWAARAAKADERPPASGTGLSVAGVVGGHVVVGDNNTVTGQSIDQSGSRRPGVGEGTGSRRPQLMGVYEQAGGEPVLGRPRWLAVKANGGYLQFFDSHDGLRTFVMWAPSRGGCVIMPESVWDALCAVGDPNGSADLPDLAGYPVSATSGLTIIDDRTLEIQLSGGRWLDGKLRRATSESTWIWQAEPRLEMNLSHWNRWPRDTAFDLRLRAIVDIAWLAPGILKSSDDRRDALLAAAAAGCFSNLFDVLGRGYEVTLAVPQWGVAKDSNHNWAHGIHICTLVTDTSGRPVAQANVMMQVPGDGYPISLLGCVDLHINLERLPADGPASETRRKMRPSAVLHILCAAVGNAVDILPDLVINDPEDQMLAKPPAVETLVETGQVGTETQRYLTLADVLDLTQLGDLPRNSGWQESGSRIVGPRQLTEQERLKFLAEGFAEVAAGRGFATFGKTAMANAIRE